MNIWRNVNDGFVGVEIGTYSTLEGKKGLVLQQIGTRVVHVYGTRWLEAVPNHGAVKEQTYRALTMIISQ